MTSPVRDQLKVGNGMQVFGDEIVLLGGHFAAGELDEIGAELIFVIIDGGLKFSDLFLMINAQVAGHLESEPDSLLGQVCHIFDGDAALLESHGGVGEKHLLKMDSRKVFVWVFGLERNEEVLLISRSACEGKRASTMNRRMIAYSGEENGFMTISINGKCK